MAELFRSAKAGMDTVHPDSVSHAADHHRSASGRESHTKKITVYLSADELLDLEQARLILRGYGISADRGRLVREAIAVMLADLDARGDDSVLAKRLDRDA
jgi:hypothetical protein